MPKGLGWGGGDRTDPANAAVHAHLERMAREANGSPAPGESTEAVVRRLSPGNLAAQLAPPSPLALPAMGATSARRELLFEQGDVAVAEVAVREVPVKQAVKVQAWVRVLLAKARLTLALALTLTLTLTRTRTRTRTLTLSLTLTRSSSWSSSST